MVQKGKIYVYETGEFIFLQKMINIFFILFLSFIEIYVWLNKNKIKHE